MTYRIVLRSYILLGPAAFALALLVSCAGPEASSLKRFEFTRPEMGMPFRIVLYGSDAERARLAATAALDRVRQLNQVFSDYEEDSELTLLSRTAGQNRAVPVSPELWQILSQSQALAARSDGAFDITAGPLVQLWRRARRQHELPRPDALERARAAVGFAKLQLDAHRRTARLTVPGMRLDLGAIAKGYGIDEALRVLKQHGIRSALVNCGGDMAAGDPPPGRSGWRIELSSPEPTPTLPRQFVSLARRALATSGDLYQYVEIDGRRYSHIVDPRTGVALTDHSLVTIIGSNCTMVDALATTVSVLGPDAGLALIEHTRGMAARILRQPAGTLEAVASPGFARYLTRDSDPSFPSEK